MTPIADYTEFAGRLSAETCETAIREYRLVQEAGTMEDAPTLHGLVREYSAQIPGIGYHYDFVHKIALHILLRRHQELTA